MCSMRACGARAQGPWEDGNEYGGAGGGIFKSTDGGNTWNKLAGGLPEDLVQAYVAIAPSDPQRLYSSLADTHETHIYRSDDAGEHWTQITTDSRPALRIGGGDLAIPKVDPKNPDVVYTTSIVCWRSTDGGKTWTGIRGAPGGDDYQNMWINPDNPNTILLVSDQGAIVTVNGGETWSSWYNQPTAQLYHVIADNEFPYRVYGGQQESGSVGIASRGNDGEITFREWHPVGVIEYGYVAPDPLHPRIVYGAGRSRGVEVRLDHGTGAERNAHRAPRRQVPHRSHRADRVFARRPAHPLLRRQRALSRPETAACRGRPSAPTSPGLIPASRQAWATWRQKTNTPPKCGAPFMRWPHRSRTSTRSGPGPTTA